MVPAIESGQSQYKSPLRLSTEGRVVVLPINASATIDVPATPLFVAQLPIVERMLGVNIGVNTANKRSETLINHKTIEPGERPFIVRVSASGNYPHNRSVSYIDTTTTTPEIAVIGGREYSDISVKGADYENPNLWITRRPGTIILYGGWGLVMESEAARMVIVTNWLLAHGITSEVVWGVSRPDLLPITVSSKSSLVSPDDFKKILLEKAKAKTDHEEFNWISALMEKTNFVVVSRAATVPFRLSDLTIPFKFSSGDGSEQFAYMVNYIFSYLNRARAPQDQFEPLKPSDLTGLKGRIELRRLFEYSGKNLGKQVGLLHASRVVHRGLHAGNITGDGTFVDVGSASGTQLGNEDTPPSRIIRDVRMSARAFDFLDYLASKKIVDPDLKRDVLAAFFQEYRKISRLGLLENTALSLLERQLKFSLHDGPRS